MPQDAFTLKYLCDELNQVLSGGKINKITQPDNDRMLLTVYTGKRTVKLLLNVNPSAPRMGITESDFDSPLVPQNFCMLMRKHLLSATLDCVKLIGFDRIVRIDFTASGEFFDSVKKSLYVELMGRYSNIILTQDGKILGGNRGINMFDNGVRPLIVGQPYLFPPVGDKKEPTDESLIEYFKSFNGGNLADYLVKGVQGIALSTASEIVSSFNKIRAQTDVDFAQKFYKFLNDFLFSVKVNPCVISCNGEIKDVCVYPYEIKGDFTFFDSLIKAEDFYFSEKEKQKIFINKKERLTALTNTQIKKVKKKLVAISSKEKDALSAEENRIKGELILSNIYRLNQGMEECELENYYDGSMVKIVLDKNLSPSKNAENFYKKYNKQKRTLTALKPQREQAQSELDYFIGVLTEIELSETIEELNLVQSELVQAGVMQEQKQTGKRKVEETFCREYEIDGFRVRVGRNNAENDKLTFTASASDVWLHAKDYHSSHVVIQTQGKKLSENVIVVSAEICAYYSKGREGGKTEIVYTEKKNVKKPPRSKLGFCTYDNFKSISVQPKKHVEFIK